MALKELKRIIEGDYAKRVEELKKQYSTERLEYLDELNKNIIESPQFVEALIKIREGIEELIIVGVPMSCNKISNMTSFSNITSDTITKQMDTELAEKIVEINKAKERLLLQVSLDRKYDNIIQALRDNNVNI